jgi:hypothetical protein
VLASRTHRQNYAKLCIAGIVILVVAAVWSIFYYVIERWYYGDKRNAHDMYLQLRESQSPYYCASLAQHAHQKVCASACFSLSKHHSWFYAAMYSLVAIAIGFQIDSRAHTVELAMLDIIDSKCASYIPYIVVAIAGAILFGILFLYSFLGCCWSSGGFVCFGETEYQKVCQETTTYCMTKPLENCWSAAPMYYFLNQKGACVDQPMAVLK